MTPDQAFLGNHYGRFVWDIGGRAERPFKVLAPIRSRSFGDVLFSYSSIARLVANFGFSHTDFIVTDSRPFTMDLAAYFPFPKKVFNLRDSFEKLTVNQLTDDLRKYETDSDAYHDFVALPSQLNAAVFWGLPRVALQIPDGQVDDATSQLIELGLDPDRWYCTIHWREPNYVHKPISNIRDSNPRTYLALIDHIIDDLGGQVVQLGHPEMHHRAARPGYVGLSSIPNSWQLQAFAVSRARFFVGSASGATALAQVFRTPSLHVDVIDWYTGEEQDWILTPTIGLGDGRKLRQEEFFHAGLMNSFTLNTMIEAGETVTLEQSTVGEICFGLAGLLIDTADVTGWRNPPANAHEPTNQVLLPASAQADLKFVKL
jgi:putative glycosyltransferase (TIGR04372 family)